MCANRADDYLDVEVVILVTEIESDRYCRAQIVEREKNDTLFVVKFVGPRHAWLQDTGPGRRPVQPWSVLSRRRTHVGSDPTGPRRL